MKKIYATFSGAGYDDTTLLIVADGLKFGAVLWLQLNRQHGREERIHLSAERAFVRQRQVLDRDPMSPI